MPPKRQQKKQSPGTLSQLFRKMQNMRVAPKKRAKGRKGPRAPPSEGFSRVSLRGNSSASKYAASILYPFSKQAEGARVPEPFSVASMVDKAHGTFSVGTSSTSGQAFDAIFTPHLLQSAHSAVGTLSGGGAALTYNTTGTNVPPTGVTVRAVTAASALASRYKSYRIVSWGLRIKPNLSPLNASGRIYVAVCPASQQMPIMFNAAGTKADWYASLDAPYDSATGGLPSTLLNMPRSRQFTMTELIQLGGVEITIPLTSPAAKTFLEAASENAEQGLTLTGSGINNALFGNISAGFASSAGFSQVMLYGEGVGTAGTATDAITVDYIYHIEAIPNVSTLGAGLVSSAPFMAPPSSPGEEHAVHAEVARRPLFDGVMRKAEDELRIFVTQNAGKVVRKVASGAAERFLGLSAIAL